MTPQEINEAVAKKLGWVVDKTSDFLPWYGRPGGHPQSAMIRELPDYCDSIQAAWEIVEAGYIDWICRLDIGKWEASKAGLKDGCIADTAPMAICLAFLKLEER